MFCLSGGCINTNFRYRFSTFCNVFQNRQGFGSGHRNAV